MRRMLFILSLAGLTLAAGANDAFAQRRGYGYGGGRGNSPSISIGFGQGIGYSSFGTFGGARYNAYNRGYGSAFMLAPSYYNATQSYYSLSPSYYTPAPSYSVVPATNYELQPQTQPAYTPAPAATQQSVTMTVLVPTTDTQVWFQGAATTQQGMERVFHSPSLRPNTNFVYNITARWMENGQAVTRERQLTVQAGQNITVDLRANSSESIPLPNAIPRN